MIAIINSAAGDSLKVAEGIYKPGTARINSFSMKSGVAVAYVNKLATGNGNGTSWADAFTELQTALQHCCKHSCILPKHHDPRRSHRNAEFWLYADNKILISKFERDHRRHVVDVRLQDVRPDKG